MKLLDDDSVSALAPARYKMSSSLEERLYATTDLNHNVTSIDDVFGAVKERFVYDPYRQSTVLSAAWASTGDLLAWSTRSQGEREDATTNTIDGRSRLYGIGMGRWMQADFAGYIDGANRYQFVRSNTIGSLDPLGLDDLHDTSLEEDMKGTSATITRITNAIQRMLADRERFSDGFGPATEAEAQEGTAQNVAMMNYYNSRIDQWDNWISQRQNELGVWQNKLAQLKAYKKSVETDLGGWIKKHHGAKYEYPPSDAGGTMRDPNLPIAKDPDLVTQTFILRRPGAVAAKDAFFAAVAQPTGVRRPGQESLDYPSDEGYNFPPLVVGANVNNELKEKVVSGTVTVMQAGAGALDSYLNDVNAVRVVGWEKSKTCFGYYVENVYNYDGVRILKRWSGLEEFGD